LELVAQGKRVQRLVEDMAETMYAAPGIGLAATQVNVHRRVIVIDVSEERDALLVLINPELIVIEGERVSEEGCLSVPGIYEPVRRAARVVVRATNQHAEPFELAAEDMLAVCIQHEIDHLEGRVFVDKLSQLKRSRIRARLQKRDRVRASA
jgi:peptide deformylase